MLHGRVHRCLAAAALGVLLCTVPVYGQVLPFTHYTPESEVRALPSAEINGVYQDRLGYLWISVYSSGLVRYDGVRMELFTEADGLQDVAVWEALEGPTGRLWVASNAGLSATEEPLLAYETGRPIRFVTELNGVPLLGVSVRRNLMTIGPDGALWVGTDALGLVRYFTDAQGRVHADTLSTAVDPGEGGEEPVRSIVKRRDNSVWVALRGGAVLRYTDPGAPPELIDRPGAPERSVSVLHEGPTGTLWGGTVGGRVWRFDETRRVFQTFSEELQSPIADIRETDGRLWVAGEGSGVLEVDLDAPAGAPGRSRVLTRQNGLLSENIHGIHEDAEGNLWFAQSGGLSKLRSNHAAFTNYSAQSFTGEQPLLPAPAVGAVAVSPGDGAPCSHWAGTAGGGLACLGGLSEAQTAYVQAADGLSSDFVNALAYDAAGRLWVGTAGGIDLITAPGGPAPPPGAPRRGLSLVTGRGQLSTYGGVTVLSIAVLPLTADARTAESVWFTAIRKAYVYAGDEWFSLGPASGLPPAVFHAVAADREGTVWIGTRDYGLYRSTRPLTLETLRTLQRQSRDSLSAADRRALDRFGPELAGALFEPVWTEATGAPTDQIEALYHMGETLWVATPVGLYALDAQTSVVQGYLGREAFGAAHAFSLARSPATGRLWVGTNAGLAEVDLDTRRVVRRVTRQDGLINNEVWYYGSVRVGGDGRVYFGTARGLSVYTPALDRVRQVIPALHLYRADYAERASGTNEIAFEYAATTFANESATRYRYRLLGYEEDWSPLTAEAKVRYTNLPAVAFPRKYEFQVIASRGDGVWTPTPLTYTFRVAPPLWFKWWAFLLYLALAVGIGVVIARYQRKRLIARERERARMREAELHAETAQAERTAAVAQAKALRAEAERQAAELEKARELESAYRALEEAHTTLKETQAQLVNQEKLASLGRLTAGVAHEIKNPLNFVNNFAHLSVELADELSETLQQERDNLSEETRDDLDDLVESLRLNAAKIASHGERADDIVRNMLSHSRSGSGERQPLTLNALLDESISLAYHGLKAQGEMLDVTVVRDFEEGMGLIEGHPEELGRVFINLFSNAYYAVAEKHAVLGDAYTPTITIRTRQVGRHVEVTLADNGPGIPEDVQPKVFEPFFTTKPPGEGTGLGLSLSYEIVVSEHNGALDMESTPGEGTVFKIQLPVRNSPAPVPSEAR